METHAPKRIAVLSNPSVGIMAVLHVEHRERVFGLCVHSEQRSEWRWRKLKGEALHGPQYLTGCTGSRDFQENLEESEQNGWLEIAGRSRGRRCQTRQRGVSHCSHQCLGRGRGDLSRRKEKSQPLSSPAP